MVSSYLKQVKKNCPFTIRKKLITNLKAHLFDYLDDNPESTIEDIINHLGPPEKYADEYLLVMDETTRKKSIQKNKLIKYCILFGTIAILFSIALTAVIMLIKISQIRVYYYYEYVTEDII